MPPVSDDRFGFSFDALLRRLTELDVGAEAAVDRVDVLAGRRIDAEHRGPSALARTSAIAFSTVRSAGASVGGSDAVFPGPPSPSCRNGPKRPMRTRIGSSESRIDADVDERVVGALLGLLDRVFEPAMVRVAAVELADEVEPFALAARDLIEVFLHLRGELDVDRDRRSARAAAA